MNNKGKFIILLGAVVLIALLYASMYAYEIATATSDDAQSGTSQNKEETNDTQELSKES